MSTAYTGAESVAMTGPNTISPFEEILALGIESPRPQSRRRPRTRHGRCFELAYGYLSDDPTWTLVHGRGISQLVGVFSHAWLKRDGYVYDTTFNRTFTAEVYATLVKIEEIATYTYREAAEHALRTGHSGPWYSLVV